MKEISAVLAMDESDIKDLVEDIVSDEVENKFDEIFEDRFDDKLDQSIEEKIESKVDDRIESYMDCYFDMDAAIESFFRSNSMSNYLDLEDSLQSILSSFSATRPCTLGEVFINAVESVVINLIQTDKSFALMIQDAIEKAIAAKYVDSLKQSIIDEYNAEIEKYFKSLTPQSSITSNNPYTTTVISSNNYQY